MISSAIKLATRTNEEAKGGTTKLTRFLEGDVVESQESKSSRHISSATQALPLKKTIKDEDYVYVRETGLRDQIGFRRRSLRRG